MKVTNKAKGNKRRGRPPKPLEERRTAKLTLRVSTKERDMIHAEAERWNLTITEMLLGPWRVKTDKDDS
jgi:hypothetical protein